MLIQLTNHISRNFIALCIICIFILLFSVDGRISAGEIISQIKYIINNQDLFQDDIYITASSKFNARYYLVHILSYLVKLFDLSPESLLIILNRITAFITFYCFYLISQHILRSSFGGLLALIILFFFSLIQFNFGNFQIWNGQINAQSFFYMFYIMAIYLCLKRYLNAAFVTLGVGSLFHFLLGAIFFFFLIITLLFSRYNYLNKEFFKVPLLGIICCIIFLTLSIYPFFFNSDSVTIMSSTEFIDLFVHDRHPHHYLLSSFSIVSWVFIFFLAVMLILPKSKQEAISKNGLFYLTVPLILSITMLPFFYLFVELLPNRFIASMSIPRMISLCGLAYLPICLSLHLTRFFETFKLFFLNFTKSFLAPTLLIFVLASASYDSFSSNYVKLDYLKYDLLGFERPKHYRSYLDLKDACKWIELNTSNTSNIIAPSSEARHLCNRSLIGGNSFPFTSNDFVLIEWANQRKDLQRSYVGGSIDFNKLKILGVNIAIINVEKDLNYKSIYKNASFSVIDVN